MHAENRSSVKTTLEEVAIHERWEKQYRTAENEQFYETAFDRMAEWLQAPPQSIILDAGCGTCAHAARLVRRGFRCHAIDFPPSVLEMAKEFVHSQGLEDQISIERQDLTALSFEDHAFEYILCWGVLMHIPDVEKAVANLSRVLAPGG